jgi:lipoic acid synthetase
MEPSQRSVPRSQVRGTGAPLRVRWLGNVPYSEAWALQQGFHRGALEAASAGSQVDDRLLLVEHPHVYTLGRNADAAHVLVDPVEVGADVVQVDRGGDVTYHGPGQLVAYPLVTLPDERGRTVAEGGLPHTRGWVACLEQVLIDVLEDLGLPGAGRHPGYPGVWVGPGTDAARKVAAIGVRVERGRTLHGVALNVAPELDMFSHIVPCGITGFGVTSLAAEGVDVPMVRVIDAFVDRFAQRWEPAVVDRRDVVVRASTEGDSDLSPFSRGEGPGSRTDGSNSVRGARREADPTGSPARARTGVSVRLRSRLAEAGVEGGIDITERKPEWMRAPLHHDPSVLATRRTIDSLGLVTVCQEAGCPNLSECWSEGTATFMLNGDRCTRACGFCLVDTRRPEPPVPEEPQRVAEAVLRLGLGFAVLTTVARDDLADEGASQIAATVRAIRAASPSTRVEVLISDCRGRADALGLILAERPDVVNHNIETVARLQRAVRPSAGYARSLSVLARSAAAGLVTKSGLVVGMGESAEEIESTLADLAALGVSIVTIGQYLRPTTNHLPVAHWWRPEDFERFAEVGRSLGIAHVESSPFTRSSYHARTAAEQAAGGSAEQAAEQAAGGSAEQAAEWSEGAGSVDPTALPATVEMATREDR